MSFAQLSLSSPSVEGKNGPRPELLDGTDVELWELPGSDLNLNKFFGPIYSAENKEALQAAVAHVCDELEEAAREAVSEPTLREDSKTERTDPRKLLEAHLPSVIRMSTMCPIAEVRTGFVDLLARLRDMGVAFPQMHTLGPSFFVPPKEILVHERVDENQATFEEIFFMVGRLSHVDQVMGWHPSFLSIYTECTLTIMRDPAGPLPLNWRNYIAIMAASRHNCENLARQQRVEFLANGGNPQWLRGLAHAPPKLQNLAGLNAFLAHQPWKITSEHVAHLVKDAHWSIAELVHAMIILVTFHSLSSFCFGMGITPEVDTHVQVPEEEIEAAAAASQPDDKDSSAKSSCTPVQLLRMLSEVQEKAARSGEEGDEEDADVFESAGTRGDTKLEVDLCKMRSNEFCARFYGVDLVYEDFNVKSADYSVFRTNEYSWKEHGYALVDRFYRGAGNLLDNEFERIYNLTYRTVNNQRANNTAPFRNGIWYYVHRLFGMMYDDYDYALVNHFLNVPLKKYVKSVACVPESITPALFNNMGVDLANDEKCHVALLACEAAKQSSLLYGLHAIMQHLN